MSTVHVAIVDRKTAEDLLQGCKRIESRFSPCRRAPHGRVSRGDRIYFKVTGKGIIGHSTVSLVREFDSLTPAAMDALRKTYGPAVRASAGYWWSRRRCRYGVLIWLEHLAPCVEAPPVPRQYGSGWVVLADRKVEI